MQLFAVVVRSMQRWPHKLATRPGVSPHLKGHSVKQRQLLSLLALPVACHSCSCLQYRCQQLVAKK